MRSLDLYVYHTKNNRWNRYFMDELSYYWLWYYLNIESSYHAYRVKFMGSLWSFFVRRKLLLFIELPSLFLILFSYRNISP